MTHWVATQEASRDRAGYVQWYLIDFIQGNGGPVGEVVCINDELGTYYAELLGRQPRYAKYFTDVEDAKAYLWTLYILEKASCN